MTHIRTHERPSKFKKFVFSMLRFLAEYAWLFFGWVFLTGILARAGMGFFAIATSLVWALGMKSSQTSNGGEVIKDFLWHVPAWLLQHVVAFLAILTMTRINWTGGSVVGLVICFTGPLLSASQFSRWFLARKEKLLAIARVEEED